VPHGIIWSWYSGRWWVVWYSKFSRLTRHIIGHFGNDFTGEMTQPTVMMGGLLHLVQRGRDWAGPQLAQAPPRCTKPTHQRPVYQSPYCCIMGSLLCSLDVPVKGCDDAHNNFSLQNTLGQCGGLTACRSRWL